MQRERYEHIVNTLVNDALEMTTKKRKSYAGSGDDVLANFKRNAERLNLTPFQVWAVYWGKHVDSVLNAIKENPSNPVDESEGLRGRIIDLQVYGWLLLALLEDQTGFKYGSNNYPKSFDPNSLVGEPLPIARWMHEDDPIGDVGETALT